MTFPNVDPKWSTNNNPADNEEPPQSVKDGGIPLGSTIARQWLNWMFNASSQLFDYIKSNMVDRDNNLSDLPDKSVSRNNLDVYSRSETDTKHSIISGKNNSDFYQEAVLNGPSGDLTSGSCKVVRVGSMVTISGKFNHLRLDFASTGNGFLPTWASPDDPHPESNNCYKMDGVATAASPVRTLSVSSDGRLAFNYGENYWFNTDYFTISYTV